MIIFISLTGNLFVIGSSFKKLAVKNQIDNSLLKANTILILNLAVADLLMSVSLIMIAAKTVKLNGNYCLLDKAWRTSLECSMVGVFFTISGETSVMTLTLMTIYRLKSVLMPIQSRHVNLRKLVAFIFAIWIISTTMAILPLLEIFNDVMLSSILISLKSKPEIALKYFQTTMVTIPDFVEYTKRVATFGNVSIPGSPGIGESCRFYKTFLDENFPRFSPDIEGYLGYYSAHAVCIPRFYKINETDQLNILTVVVISFNFIAMCFIAVAYGIIYRKSQSAPTSIVSTTPRDHKINRNMQIKITILVATDFLCWFPICLASFISMTVIPIPKDVYAFSAIVQLPINSAFNPLIYSQWLFRVVNFIRNKAIKPNI